jgi:hypothetical protein
MNLPRFLALLRYAALALLLAAFGCGGSHQRVRYRPPADQGGSYDRDADGIPDSVDRLEDQSESIKAEAPPAPAPAQRRSLFSSDENTTPITLTDPGAAQMRASPPPPVHKQQNAGKPAPGMPGAVSPPNAPSAPHGSAYMIYSAEFGVTVLHVDPALAAIEAMGRELGGYLASRADRTVTIRVPRERFDEAIKRIEKMGDVYRRSLKAEDVTDQYMDLETRLTNARAMKARLQALLVNAPVSEAVAIEKELGRVSAEIEAMEGKLKLLQGKIAYSTITVELRPLVDANSKAGTVQLPFDWLGQIGLGSLLDVYE